MIEFPEVSVTFLPKTWVRVTSPLVFGGTFPQVVPAGTESDGGSIPAAGWLLVGHPFSYQMLPLYIAHDYELQTGVRWIEAARRLRERMKEREVNAIRRVLVGVAVTAYAVWRTYVVRSEL
jgi:hypothetical protein